MAQYFIYILCKTHFASFPTKLASFRIDLDASRPDHRVQHTNCGCARSLFIAKRNITEHCAANIEKEQEKEEKNSTPIDIPAEYEKSTNTASLQCELQSVGVPDREQICELRNSLYLCDAFPRAGIYRRNKLLPWIFVFCVCHKTKCF